MVQVHHRPPQNRLQPITACRKPFGRLRAIDTQRSVSDLWSIAREQLRALFEAVEGAEVLWRDNSLLGITGGPSADFNMCLVDDSLHVEEILAESIHRLNLRRVPGVFMVSAQAADKVGGRIAALGLSEAGEAPMMVFTGQPSAVSAGYHVTQVDNETDLAVVADLVASAFDLDRAWIGRTFASPALLASSDAVQFFIAKATGRPMSTLTTTGAGSVVGIWSMATWPEAQRRGAGKAALLGAIERKQACGAELFYLIATPAGQPLYVATGFKTVETFPLFVFGSAAH